MNEIMEYIAGLIEFDYNAKDITVTDNEVVATNDVLLITVTKLAEPVDGRSWRFRLTPKVIASNQNHLWAVEQFASDEKCIKELVRSCEGYYQRALRLLANEYKKLNND